MSTPTKKGDGAPAGALLLGFQTAAPLDHDKEPGAGCCTPEFRRGLDDLAFLDRPLEGPLADHVRECRRCREALRNMRTLYTAPLHVRGLILYAAGRRVSPVPAPAPRRGFSLAAAFPVAAVLVLTVLLALGVTGRTLDLTKHTQAAPRRDGTPPAVIVSEPVVDERLRAAVEVEIRLRGLCTGNSVGAQARCARLAAEMILQARPVDEAPRLAALAPDAEGVRRVLQGLAERGAVVSPAAAPSSPTAQASTGDGVLSVRIVPSGEITIDGLDVGPGPRNFRLPAGTYRVGAVRPGGGRREAFLPVFSGKRTSWDVDLSKP